jgi:hypothetical protein
MGALAHDERRTFSRQSNRFDESACREASMKKVGGSLLLVAILLVRAAGADAQSTFVSLASEPGDYIGQGQTLLFTPDMATIQASSNVGNGEVHVTVFPFAGGFWFLDFAAPSGQSLLPGAYEQAERWPFQPPNQPGLSVSGDGRGCNTLTGRFVVLDALFGPSGYVQRFHATFEQHCEGAAPALLGEVDIVNPPPPEPLGLSAVVNARGSADLQTGTATIRGTVTCTQATTANLFGSVTQRATRFAIASGNFSLVVNCSPVPTRWSATVSPATGVPFNPGTARLDLSLSAFDPNYQTLVTEQVTAGVHLTRSSR